MSTKTTGGMRLSMGFGRSYTIPGAVVEQYANRPVHEALRAMAEEHLHDPEIRDLLSEPSLALELYAEDRDGALHESPLHRTDDWNRVVDKLEGKELEVAMARTHRGGV